MKLFPTIIRFLVYATIFLLPLFFFPFFSEYFFTAKLYFFAAISSILLVIAVLSAVAKRHITIHVRVFDAALLIFVIAAGLSVLFTSPNKVSALTNINMGMGMILSGALFYFVIAQSDTIISRKTTAIVIAVSAVFVTLFTVISSTRLLASLALPGILGNFSQQGFLLPGSAIATVIFLLFAEFIFIFTFGKAVIHHPNKLYRALFFFVCCAIALGILVLRYLAIIHPEFGLFTLPPANISWFAALETLKAPLTALLGIGINNYGAMFTRVKDFSFNQSALWPLSAFSFSRFGILHILTETGLLGFVGFSLMTYHLARSLAHKYHVFGMIFSVAIITMIIFLPISLYTWFFFLLIAALFIPPQHSFSFTLESDIQLVAGIFVFVVVLSLCLGEFFFINQGVQAEIQYQKAISALQKNEFVPAYTDLQKAISLNPYDERMRTDFSRLNMQFAINALVAKQQKKEQLTDEEKQTIIQAIQTAIAEAKAVVTLNQSKATNWENLAIIYRNVINLAQGADTWTISAYQRAIVLDPQNPSYRLSLGGVYYGLADYDNAISLFTQTINLKSDWPNAYYNLAWAYAQKKNYQAAASFMQNVLSLLDKQRDKVDYERAQSDSKLFQSAIQKENTTTETTNTKTQEKLSLPKAPEPKLSPKLSLPKESSPEAK